MTPTDPGGTEQAVLSVDDRRRLMRVWERMYAATGRKVTPLVRAAMGEVLATAARAHAFGSHLSRAAREDLLGTMVAIDALRRAFREGPDIPRSLARGRVRRRLREVLDAAATEAARQSVGAAEDAAFFEAVIDRMPIGVVVTDLAGTLVLANRTAHELTGGYLRPLSPEARDRYYATDQRGRRVAPREMRQRFTHGERLRGSELTWHTPERSWALMVHSEYLASIGGRPPTSVITFQDVTQRRRAEDELLRSEERFRVLFEMAPVGMAQADPPTGRFLLVNERMCQITGYTRDELLERTFVDVTHPDDRIEDVARFQRLLRGEKAVYTAEKRYVRKDGRIAWVEVTVSALRKRSGEPFQTIAVIRDVTARREAVARLDQARADLQRVTAELFRAQDEERRRVSRDLHDGAAQSVFAAALELGRLRHHVEDVASGRAIAECEALCGQALRQIRTLSYVLHPPGLDELGLPAALRWYVDGFSARSGIRASYDGADVGRLSPAIEMALFRVVQEALTNVQRHARAHTVRVALRSDGGNAVLAIRDDGRGIADERSLRTGVGIAGMRERLRLLGGTLVIRSGASGTELLASAPYVSEPSSIVRAGPRM